MCTNYFKPPLPNALEQYRRIANSLDQPPKFGSLNPWWEPKTEWVDGYYRLVPNGVYGHRYEWVPGYWRRA